MSSRSNHCQQCVAFSTDTGYPTRQGSRRYGRSAAADAARAQHQDISCRINALLPSRLALSGDE
eukprot:546500-Amphidinium_carterae.1